jgi:predicted transcriptional regulator
MSNLDFSGPETAGLHNRQKLVLAALRQTEPTTAREIAELLSLPRRSVNNALIEIMEAGIASRAARVEDGVQHYIWTINER